MIDLGNGKQVVVTADQGALWLQIFANKGSLGVDISDERVAMDIAGTIIAGVRKNRRARKQAGSA